MAHSMLTHSITMPPAADYSTQNAVGREWLHPSVRSGRWLDRPRNVSAREKASRVVRADRARANVRPLGSYRACSLSRNSLEQLENDDFAQQCTIIPIIRRKSRVIICQQIKCYCTCSLLFGMIRTDTRGRENMAKTAVKAKAPVKAAKAPAKTKKPVAKKAPARKPKKAA